MLLTLDIGNTNISMGVYDGRELKFVARLSTDRLRTKDQYAVDIRAILDIYKTPMERITGSIICSVVPQLTNSIKEAVRSLTGTVPLIVGPGIKTGLNIKISNPSQLGADLVAGCVGAIEHYPCPSIIIDMGTATTIMVVGRDKGMLGGCIIPGLVISMEALTSRTALLQSVSFEAPQTVVGTNTVDCMRSGLIYGNAAMIDGMCDRIEQELNEKCTVVATGGLAGIIVNCCKRKIELDPNLLLEGMRIIYEKNKN